jgi:hypothetical protein
VTLSIVFLEIVLVVGDNRRRRIVPQDRAGTGCGVNARAEIGGRLGREADLAVAHRQIRDAVSIEAGNLVLEIARWDIALGAARAQIQIAAQRGGVTAGCSVAPALRYSRTSLASSIVPQRQIPGGTNTVPPPAAAQARTAALIPGEANPVIDAP